MNTTAIGPPRPHFERQGSAPPPSGTTGASGGDLTKGLKLEKGPNRSKQVTSASASTFVSTSEPAWSARSSFESTKTDISSSKNNDQDERRDNNRSHLPGDSKSNQTYSHGRLERPLLERPLLERPLLERPLLERPLLERPLLSTLPYFDPSLDGGSLEKLQLAGDSPWLQERDSVLDRTPTRSSLESGCAGDCGGSYLPSSELNVVLGEAYGAHFVPGTQNEAGTLNRSSLDLLLTAPQVLTMNGSRHSLDSLQEMFINRGHGKTTVSVVGQLAKAMPTAAQRLLRVGDNSQSSGQCAMNASSPVSSPSKIAFSKPKRSLADTSITVIAQPTTVNAGAMSSSANSGASVGALASAVVDQSTAVTGPHQSFVEEKDCLWENCSSRDGEEEQRGVVAEASSSFTHSPTPLARSPPRPKHGMSDKDSAKNTASSAVSYPGTGLVDADLHDTFGAHAWYLGPAGNPAGRPAPKATGSTSPRPPKFSKMLEPTTVAGQHSVTLHDAQSTVPSYDYLRQLRTVKEKQKKANGIGQGSGYIAEAKRVLNEAMANDASRKRISPSNAIEGQQENSYSGAIGPLLRLVTAGLEAKEDEKVRGALHTLSLLVTNLPNRGILCDLGGRSVLMGVIRDEEAALDCREWAVQLLWDLEPEVKRPLLLGRQCAAMLRSEDAMALLALLADTGEARIASHILHFLNVAFVEKVWDARPVSPGAEHAGGEDDQNHEQSDDEKPGMTAFQKSFVAESIVREVCAHKHHLYDAAQYTVGELLGSVLEDDDVPDQTVSSAVAAVLRALDECFDYVQCQILLTVLSCLAGRRRLRKELEKDASRRVIHAYVRRVQDSDQRLRARALSLVKVAGGMREEEEASREDKMFMGTWYFGPEDS